MAVKGLYPGSFDPVTNGHLDLALRSLDIFDELVIGVYDTPSKNLIFNTQERVALFANALGNAPNVTVTPYSGLTVDHARKINAKAILRGLRAITDFENEFEMALMNRKLNPDIEVVCLMTSLEHLFLSSSRVKEVASLGGEIKDLVPPNVAQALIDRLAGKA